MHRYWTVLKMSCKENIHDWPTRKFCTIRKTHQLTDLQLWPQIDRVRVPTRSVFPLFSRFAFFGFGVLYPNMKKWLAGRRFYSNEEVIAETNTYFAELDKFYYSEGINKLEHPRKKTSLWESLGSIHMHDSATLSLRLVFFYAGVLDEVYKPKNKTTSKNK